MGVDRGSQQIRRMFASVAHRYDLLNRLLSLSIDRYWRRVAKNHLLKELPGDPWILDLCTGTADVALEFAGDARVVGCDFCRPMLTRGAVKIRRKGVEDRVALVEGDALRLPFPPESFHGVTIAFGLRNLEDYEAGLREMFRVLRPGGRLAVLEFSEPTLPLIRQAYLFYFTRVLPRIGRIVSGKEGPYSYLPASVGEFPPPERLKEMMLGAGFKAARSFGLSLRVATLYVAGR
jgi:demethylmenaquinone methyltransferase / 2-methoxy-6-polyprenyl-1,4-benzoquinol methylase